MSQMELLIQLREEQRRKIADGNMDAVDVVVGLSIMIHELQNPRERREVALMPVMCGGRECVR